MNNYLAFVNHKKRRLESGGERPDKRRRTVEPALLAPAARDEMLAERIEVKEDLEMQGM